MLPLPALAPAPAPAPGPGPGPGPPIKKRRVSITDTMKAQYKLEAEANTTAIDDKVNAEIKKFESIKLSVAADDKYTMDGIFDLVSFYSDRAHCPCTALARTAFTALS